jgi:signal transduction histidine kinase
VASTFLADLDGRVREQTRLDAGHEAARPTTSIEELHQILCGGALGPAAAAALESAAAHGRALLPISGEGPACLSFASRALCGLVLESATTPEAVDLLVLALARTLRVSPEQAAFQLLDATAAEPTFLELPPALSIDAQLLLLQLLAPVEGISLWRRDVEGKTSCIARTPGRRPNDRTRTLASLTIEGGREGRAGKQLPQYAVPVHRWQRPHGALAATAEQESEVALASLRITAARLAPLLERQMLLERNAAHERSLVEASERRLTRLGYDLHDGPMQELVVLAYDLMAMRRRVDALVDDSGRLEVAPAFDELHERIVEIDRSLRELAQSLEARSLVEQPLRHLLEREIGSLVERCEIEANLSVTGDVDDLTTSQRLTLFRVIQEALTNVREHSGATQVTVAVESDRGNVTATVIDDGTGFEVSSALVSAARRGRLGLVGIHERVRLLGGAFEVDSKPGGPTRLTLTLPHWKPLGSAEVEAHRITR